MSPITVRTPVIPPTRDQITKRCATLLSQREDQDPTGAAYQATSMQLDDALSALFSIGPKDPWAGEPA